MIVTDHDKCEKTCFTITRIDKDGTRTLVGYTEDLCEIGVMIHEDRDKYDTTEDTYEVVQEDA